MLWEKEEMQVTWSNFSISYNVFKRLQGHRKMGLHSRGLKQLLQAISPFPRMFSKLLKFFPTAVGIISIIRATQWLITINNCIIGWQWFPIGIFCICHRGPLKWQKMTDIFCWATLTIGDIPFHISKTYSSASTIFYFSWSRFIIGAKM